MGSEMCIRDSHRTGSRGPKASDINSRAVLGSLHIGVGQTQLNNLLATLNVPTMNSQLFKMREREIGNSIEKVAKAGCDMYLEQEKENAEKSNNQGEVGSMPGIAVSYDMGWTKRGKGEKRQRAQLTHWSRCINGFKNWKGSVLCDKM